MYKYTIKTITINFEELEECTINISSFLTRNRKHIITITKLIVFFVVIII